GPQIPLAHPGGVLGSGNGLVTSSACAGMAVNARGDTLVVANFLNDSVSIIDLAARKKVGEVDLRPGISDPAQSGVAGGEVTFWVAIKGNEKAYVSSLRDREIVAVDLTGTPAVIGRIPVSGQPNKLILNQAQNLLFSTLDNSDSVAIASTETDTVLETIPTT